MGTVNVSSLKEKLKQLIHGKVSVGNLFLFVGLKRSGLHAVSFWLLGHCKNHALVNNSPMKFKGDGSPMSRTNRRSPLPVHLYPGYPVSVCQENREVDSELPASLEMLIVLFQSQALSYLEEQGTGVTGINASTIRPILILRNPFNWAASYMQKSQNSRDAAIWPKLWKEYADEFLGRTNYLQDPVKINYDKWFIDRDYRKQVSEQLGLVFTDATLEVVTSHAGGSSFDETQFSEQAQSMKVTERWKQYQNNRDYIKSFTDSSEIIELAREIFEFPPDLSEFANSLYRG